MKNFFVISSTPSSPEWKHIFTTILNYCDHFEVVYPIAEFEPNNPLLGGKLEIEGLDGTTVKPWDGMDDSISFCGELNSISKQIIHKLEAPSFEGGKPELWCFQLFKNGKLFLSVQDFTVCLLENHQEMNLLLEENSINIDKLN